MKKKEEFYKHFEKMSKPFKIPLLQNNVDNSLKSSMHGGKVLMYLVSGWKICQQDVWR